MHIMKKTKMNQRSKMSSQTNKTKVPKTKNTKNLKKRSQKLIEGKERDINLETCNLKNEKNRKNIHRKN
jgi:hypothetical protein